MAGRSTPGDGRSSALQVHSAQSLAAASSASRSWVRLPRIPGLPDGRQQQYGDCCRRLAPGVDSADPLAGRGYGAAGRSSPGPGRGQSTSYVLTLLVFAFNLRYLPDIRIAWRYVLGGAAVTAHLFAVGRHLIGLYVRFFAAGSAYGAAGSVIVVLLWVYHSAQVFFLGAELTQALAQARPSHGDSE